MLYDGFRHRSLMQTICTVFKAARRPLAPPTRRPGLRSRCRSRYGRASAGRLARMLNTLGPRLAKKLQGRGGFDKGTLAMARIGLTRAGQKPARFAG